MKNSKFKTLLFLQLGFCSAAFAANETVAAPLNLTCTTTCKHSDGYVATVVVEFSGADVKADVSSSTSVGANSFYTVRNILSKTTKKKFLYSASEFSLTLNRKLIEIGAPTHKGYYGSLVTGGRKSSVTCQEADVGGPVGYLAPESQEFSVGQWVIHGHSSPIQIVSLNLDNTATVESAVGLKKISLRELSLPISEIDGVQVGQVYQFGQSSLPVVAVYADKTATLEGWNGQFNIPISDLGVPANK